MQGGYFDVLPNVERGVMLGCLGDAFTVLSADDGYSIFQMCKDLLVATSMVPVMVSVDDGLQVYI